MSTSDSENSNDFREQFLDDYCAECYEHLALIRRHLLTLETEIGKGNVDIAVLDDLFRSFHTLKGISGMVGLTAAEQLAHSIESMLRSLRHAELTLTVERLEGLIAGVFLLEQVIAARKSDQAIPNIEPVVDQLRVLSESNAQASSGAPTLQIGIRKTAGDRETAERTWIVEFTPSSALSERGININAVRSRLQQLGEIITSKPQVKGEGEISFQFVIATRVDVADFPDWASDGISASPVEVETPAQEAVVEGEPVHNVRNSAIAPKAIQASAPANIVRVDLAKLDELMRMIGEMVSNRARLEDQVKHLKRSLPAAEWRGLWETTQAMSRQLRDLREGVMAVRMVPVGEIFERMQFVVRDLARESGKRVSLELLGRETEIDKFLVERMSDPLLHLVRNAVSHGLERPDEREAQGKPAEARLSLRAAAAGGNVVIQVSDDGRGIDRKRVGEKAIARGVLDPGETLDDRALLEMICLPGLSTRAEADRESGRGVGMDVVRKTVEELNGTLAVSTEAGRGTTFTVELPLTLAIADALIVNAGGQTFAVPQTVVREVIEVQSSEVRALERNEIVAYRDAALPLLRLSKIFNLPKSDATGTSAFHVFVTGTGANAVGIAVDRIVGHREIVVRGIGDSLARVPGIAGATDLGDERVVLILDIPALRRSALEGNLAS